VTFGGSFSGSVRVGSGALRERGSGWAGAGPERAGAWGGAGRERAGAGRFGKGQGAGLGVRERAPGGPERGRDRASGTLPLGARFGGPDRGGGGTLRQPWFGPPWG
jgi:hypothetical protein